MDKTKLRKATVEFLSSCEGYHSLLKTLHWSASHHAEHVLTDDIDSEVLSTEDEIAEVVMGLLNTKFGVGELKTLLPEAKTLPELLNEMKNDVVKYKAEAGEDAVVAGLHSALDDFMLNINKWSYLKTLL